MKRLWFGAIALAALAGCTTVPRTAGRAPVQVQIVALNDFHGALEPPKSAVPAQLSSGETVSVPAGGAAYLASAIATLKRDSAHSVVVSAGDLISASPFASSQFLDEPAVLAMNLMGLDLNAVGNHEFDRGPAELLRMQNGGCEKHTARQPCRLDPGFPGARFGFLAANVRASDGSTLLPATSLKTFGKGRSAVQIGFIGLTLKDTPTLVVPSSVAGLRFEEEADTINALVPQLRAQGAEAIVVLIHQGLYTKTGYNDKSCGGVSGDLLPVLARLDSTVDLVVSGHTHRAYVCDYSTIDPSRPFLVTSAGRSGTLLTDIRLSIDPRQGKVVSKRADNIIVQGEPYTGSSGSVPLQSGFQSFAADARVKALVARYVAAAEPIASRVVGRLGGPALRAFSPSGESVLGNLVADTQRRAVNADIGFMNSAGLRADLVPGPDGSVTYGQLYSVQPFGNVVQVKGMTGRQLRAVLEQQFDSGSNTVASPMMLLVSDGFTYSYDLRKPAGQRISDIRLAGAVIENDRVYRVAVSNFLATGGDNFTVFREGTDIAADGPIDVDAFEAYVAAAGSLVPPPTNRIRRLDAPTP